MTALTECDWARQVIDLGRPTETASTFVAAPELLATTPGCDQAVNGAVTTRTTDDGPLDQRETRVVVAQCGRLVTALRVDAASLAPLDEQGWLGPLVTTVLASVGAAGG